MAVRLVVAIQQHRKQFRAPIVLGFGEQARLGNILGRKQRAHGAAVEVYELGHRGDHLAYLGGLTGNCERGIAYPREQDPMCTSHRLEHGLERESLAGATLGSIDDKVEFSGLRASQKPVQLVHLLAAEALEFGQDIGIAGARERVDIVEYGLPEPARDQVDLRFNGSRHGWHNAEFAKRFDNAVQGAGVGSRGSHYCVVYTIVYAK